MIQTNSDNQEIFIENDISEINQENSVVIIENEVISDSVYFSVKPSQNQKIYLKYYWKLLLIIGAFYFLPSLQFILFQIKDKGVHCYYNNKCKHDFMKLPAFNNVVSNLGYIILGIIYISYIYFTQRIDNGLGIHTDVSLYYSLGISLIFEGIFSSMYHLCPSTLNFQFDTSFMFIGIILMYLTIFQKRHPDKMPGPPKTYLSLALLIAINMFTLSGVINGSELLFWIPVLLIMAYIMIYYTYYLYFGKSLNINLDLIYNLSEYIRSFEYKDIPKILLLAISYTLTLTVSILSLYDKPNFTDWLLGNFIINLFIYFIYYITQKLYFKEIISKIWILLLIANTTVMAAAVTFYNIPVSNKILSPKESDELNKQCVLFNYFDYHDIWHMLSAAGLFLMMVNIYHIDKKLNNVLRNEINIF